MPKATDVTALLNPEKKEPVENPFLKFGAKAGPGNTIVKDDAALEEKDEIEEQKVDPPKEKKVEQKVEELKKKEPGFIERTKQEAAAAKKLAQEEEAKRRALEEENGKFKTELDELRAKLDDATSKKEVEEVRKKLEAAQRRNDELNEKYGSAKKKIAFYDLNQDEDFQKDYVAPLDAAWKQAASIVGTDQQRMTLLRKIGNVQTAALAAGSPEAKDALEIERDQLLDQLSEGMPESRKRRLDSLMTDIIIKHEKHHEALSNWESTAAQIRERQQEAKSTALKTVRERWTSSYDQAAEKIAVDLVIPESLKGVMDAHQIVPDTTKDEIIAKSLITGGQDYAPEEIARIIKQGASYSILTSLNKAKDKQIKELEDTIKELRGESTQGSDGRAGRERNKNSEDKEKEKKESFFSKFAPK